MLPWYEYWVIRYPLIGLVVRQSGEWLSVMTVKDTQMWSIFTHLQVDLGIGFLKDLDYFLNFLGIFFLWHATFRFQYFSYFFIYIFFNFLISLGNVTIPAGSSIVVHVWSVNRNSKYWGPDAAEFKPQRWLSSGTVPDHHAAYASFAPGRRSCIGKLSISFHLDISWYSNNNYLQSRYRYLSHLRMFRSLVFVNGLMKGIWPCKSLLN